MLRAAFSRLGVLAGDFGDFLFMRREMLGIKHRAERTSAGLNGPGLTI